MDAETALTRSQQRFNSAIYTYLAALARLDYAMGRQQGTILRQASVPEGALAPLPKEPLVSWPSGEGSAVMSVETREGKLGR